MALGTLNILIILIFLTHEHKVSLHLFLSSSVSFIKFLPFWLYRSFTFCLNLFLVVYSFVFCCEWDGLPCFFIQCFIVTVYKYQQRISVG